MWLLGYPDWLLMVNYAIARVPKVVAKVILCGCYVTRVVAKVFLCSC